jgi:hypothetical protein
MVVHWWKARNSPAHQLPHTPDDPLAPAAEKAQGILAPVITGTAAAQPFHLDLFATGTEQSELARPSPLFEKLQAFHRA